MAIYYLHLNNISHRDLKLDNILADRSGQGDISIKVADFGFAEFFDPKELMLRQCGTRPYMAPEIFRNKGYTEKVDIWSLGIITCVLLIGKFPI